MVLVVEAFSDFAPPCNAKLVVEDLLASTPAEKVAGLRTVVLTNTTALKGRRKRGWSWHRGRKSRHADALGMYHGEWHGEKAWIELFVDQIVADIPRWALRFRLVRTFAFGSTLYHEIGHHIHRRHRPEQREPEDVADDWKRILMRGHVRRSHSVIRFVVLRVAWTARLLRGRHRRPSMVAR
jgi:hypothetical protein